MIHWFAKLKWKPFLTSTSKAQMTELDRYADFTFDNGTNIRVSKGDMAHTSFKNQYEISVKRPFKDIQTIPMLDKENLVRTMENLHNENSNGQE